MKKFTDSIKENLGFEIDPFSGTNTIKINDIEVRVDTKSPYVRPMRPSLYPVNREDIHGDIKYPNWNDNVDKLIEYLKDKNIPYKKTLSYSEEHAQTYGNAWSLIIDVDMDYISTIFLQTFL